MLTPMNGWLHSHQVVTGQGKPRNPATWAACRRETTGFHPSVATRDMASGWPPIGCEGFNTNLNIPSPIPTILVFS